jgi:lipopolysaccharide/colanic/teichoic acid biosynthesis glycosyltransferase/nucleotide-binding universal stress UspA family protein
MGSSGLVSRDSAMGGTTQGTLWPTTPKEISGVADPPSARSNGNGRVHREHLAGLGIRRKPGEQGDPAGRRRMGALRIHRLTDAVALRLAPAVVAGLVAWLGIGNLGRAVLVMLSMLASAHLLGRSRFPLSLLPVGRIAMLTTAPVLGGLGALMITAFAGDAIAPARLVAPVVAAWLTLAIGVWVKSWVERVAPARVAVVGSPELTADLREELVAEGVRSHEIIGWLAPPGPATELDHLRRLGSPEDLRTVVVSNAIDLVVCGSPQLQHREPGPAPPSQPDLAEMAGACVGLPVRVLSANQFYEELLGHVPVGTIDAGWYRYIEHPRFRPTSGPEKRLFDLVVGGLLGLIALPIVAVAALAIKLGDGGPVFYRQRRLGEGGAPFEIIKLRTMSVDAELDGRPRWAEAGDVRVTAVGRLLRRSHADELPQLWNILRGDMTMVGPRPERPELVSQLERQYSHYSRRHLVKPGLAGWAQVRCGYAGSELGTAWKLGHDLFYIKHRSTTGDLLITLESMFVAFRDAHRALRIPAERFILGEHAHG